MAKYYGTSVKTGRVGASVFRINRGVTVESQYQPNVANPSTTLQIEQRAKMKLASQVAAALSLEVKPFGRDKMASARNLFIKDLFAKGAITYANGTANLDSAKMNLTNSRLEVLSQISATGTQSGATITGVVIPEFRDKVMGIRLVFLKPHAIPNESPDLMVMSSTTVVPTSGQFSAEVLYNRDTAMTVLLYAYMPESEAAVLRYKNIVASTGDMVISLETVRKELASGMLYSITYAQKVLVS